MGKKRKTGAAIGYILALAIVCGTVVFSNMVNPGAAAKTKSLIGDSTGNIISAYTSNKGFDKTKSLMEDSFGSWFEPVAEDAEFTSFTLNFHIATEVAEDTDSETKTVNGTVFSDKNYTYLKVNTTTLTAVENKQISIEYFYCKDLDIGHETEPMAYIPNPKDSFLNESKKWKESHLDILKQVEEEITDHIQVSSFFTSADVWEFDVITGQFEFNGAANGSASFTVGYNPRLMITGVKELAAVKTLTCRYSHLNNTVVVVPDGVKKLLLGA